MNYRALINEIIVKEFARIASLFQLSTTDDAELDNLLPDTIKNKSVTKNIVQFFKDNGNKPSLRQDIVDYYGYPDTATIGSIFKEMQRSGAVISSGLSKPKAVHTPSGLGQGRPITNISDRDDESKVKYIISKLKTGAEPNEEYKNWFTSTYGEEKYTSLQDLISQYNSTNDKDQTRAIKNKISGLLQGLGFVVKQRGRKPKYTNPVRTPNPDTGFDDVSYDDEEELAEYGNSPSRPRELPGIAEPPTKTPGPAPKRRTLNPPKEAPKTKPKAEGKVNENEKNILDKIVDRYKKNNGTIN